jgi:hypothetical protein
MSHESNLYKVINETYFTRSGVTIKKLIGGFEVFGQKVKTMEEVDEVIKKGYKTIEKSIHK